MPSLVNLVPLLLQLAIPITVIILLVVISKDVRALRRAAEAASLTNDSPRVGASAAHSAE